MFNTNFARDGTDFNPGLYNKIGAISGCTGTPSNIQGALSNPGMCFSGGKKNKIYRKYIMKRSRKNVGGRKRRKNTRRLSGGSGYGFNTSQGLAPLAHSKHLMSIKANGAEAMPSPTGPTLFGMRGGKRRTRRNRKTKRGGNPFNIFTNLLKKNAPAVHNGSSAPRHLTRQEQFIERYGYYPQPNMGQIVPNNGLGSIDSPGVQVNAEMIQQKGGKRRARRTRRRSNRRRR